MNTYFISTKQVKDLVNEQKFTSTQDIMELSLIHIYVCERILLSVTL